MFQVESSTLNLLNDSIIKGLKECTGALLFDKFIKKILNDEYEKHKHEFPRTIKIPKDINSLLDGDFTPEREFVLEDAPRLSDGTPVWFMKPEPGVLVNFGYMNGDSRYISNISLNDQTIHMFTGGRTGMGKSVLVNGLVFSMALMYAPWDLKLCMFDPKIVEFKRYGLGDVLPHIEVIGATSDSDFIITSLQHYTQEMNMVNQMFPISKTSNILEFRNKTGLALPQVVVVMDEVTAGVTNAGKRASVMQKAIDDFARLGRSSGRHLILASQEIGDSIPPKTMDQISIRAALGCSESASNIILGNTGAKKLKTKGKILVNTDIEEHSMLNNIEYRVPYQSNEVFASQKQELANLGKKYNFKYDLMFYNQTEYVHEGEEFINFLDKCNPDNELKLVLGEASYFKEGKDKFESIILDGNDKENIMCICNTRKSLERYTKMIAANCTKLKDKIVPIVLYKDPNDLEFLDKFYFSSKLRIKSTESPIFNQMIALVFDRSIMLEADESIFSSSSCITYDSVTEEVFNRIIADHDEFNSDLYKRRCSEIIKLVKRKNFDKFYAVSSLSGDALTDSMYNMCIRLFLRYNMCNCDSRQLNVSHLTKQMIFILGLNSINGFENFPDRNFLNLLVSAASMSYETNITFFFTTTIVDESLSVAHCCRYYLLDDTDTRIMSRIKCEDFPDKKPSIAGVLFDRSENIIHKYKKMVFEGEIIKD